MALVGIRTIKDGLDLLDGAAPPGLRFRLEHTEHKSWLDAPRPDWILYLLRREGWFGPAKLEIIDRVVVSALADFETDGQRRPRSVYPLSQGAETVRRLVIELR